MSGGRPQLHPPEDRPLPADRAVFGSKSGWVNKTEAAANRSVDATAVICYWDVRGYMVAPKLLKEYLNNHGADWEYRFTSGEMWQILRTAEVVAVVKKSLEEIKAIARRDPQIGIKREITSGWHGNIRTDTDGDIASALGHFDVAVGSDTTVFSTGDDGGLRADIEYKVYVYDFYNFDFLDSSVVDIPSNINNEMRELEEVGWARSFKSRGESAEPRQWSGVL